MAERADIETFLEVLRREYGDEIVIVDTGDKIEIKLAQPPAKTEGVGKSSG